MATMTRPEETPAATRSQVLDFLSAAYERGDISWSEYLDARTFVADVGTELPTVTLAGLDEGEIVAVTLTHRGVLCDCGKGLLCPYHEQAIVDADGLPL